MNTYGCHNRARYNPTYKAQDGYWDDGVRRILKLVSVPFRMAADCQYTKTELGKKDTFCIGCKWRSQA